MKPKLIRITTVPQSLKNLLKGQLSYMSSFYEVIGVASPGELLQEVEKQENIQVIPVAMTRTISPFKDLKALWNLYKIIKKEKPAIVHTHTPKAGLLGMLASKLAGVPIRLHTVAGLPLVEAKGLKLKILIAVEKLTYACAHKVYPNSKGQYDFIVQHKFTKLSKLKIIGNGSSNGIDTQFFNPDYYSVEKNAAFREQWKINKNDFVFIFIGRLVKDKGINELIAAFVEFEKTNKNCSLLLVGKYENDLDPLQPETNKQINTHPKIIFAGYQQDVRPFFAMSNCLVFPSYREGFPNVVMQAGAMGLPAIVTNINGCNEIVSDNINGIIIPVKSKGAIRDAMNTMIINKTLYNTCKLNARNFIKNRYDRTLIWESLKKEYKDFIINSKKNINS